MIKFCLLLLFCVGVLCVPAEGFSPVRHVPQLVRSSDGFIEVLAADVPGDPVGYRLPLLRFSSRLVQDIEHMFHLSMPRGEAGIILHAQEGTTNDARVIVRSVRRGKSLLTRIWLPSPADSDLEALRLALVKGYFSSWVARKAPAGKKACPLPTWFLLGLMRSLSVDAMQADKRRTLEHWMGGHLISFPALCAALDQGFVPPPEICGYLISWLRQKKLLESTLLDYARGQSLTGALLAEALTHEKTPAKQDQVSDERLAQMMRAVLTPGLTTAFDKRLFQSRLLLFSPFFDKNRGVFLPACSCEEVLLAVERNPSLRRAAWQKAHELPLCVIGRGAALMEVAECYRRFLMALARSEEPRELRDLFETSRQRLEKLLNEDRTNDNR